MVAEEGEIPLLLVQTAKWASIEGEGMTKKSIQEINFTSGQKRNGKSAVHRKGMPTVRCVCGSEILVLPDLKAMNRAIKNHVAEHKQADMV